MLTTYRKAADNGLDTLINNKRLIRLYKEGSCNALFGVQKMLLYFFLISEHLNRDRAYNFLAHFLYAFFKQQPVQWNTTINDILQLCCPKQDDKLMMNDYIVQYLVKKYYKRLTKSKFIIDRYAFLEAFNKVILPYTVLFGASRQLRYLGSLKNLLSNYYMMLPCTILCTFLMYSNY